MQPVYSGIPFPVSVMSRHAPGTPIEGPYDSYTAEQLAWIEEHKDRSYAKGILPAKFVNHVLYPDGTLDDDSSSLVTNAKAAIQQFTQSHDMTDVLQLDRARVMARKAEEVADHLAQERFLFVVDTDGVPVVYFQCATTKAKLNGKVGPNPDIPKKATKADAARLDEARTDVTETIRRAHAAATQRRAAANVGVIQP